MTLSINGKKYDVDVDGDMPLLWVLRDELGLTGTKYGCGIGFCGACLVLVDGSPAQSCLLKVENVKREITTIEGLGDPEVLHILQEEWIENQVAQCGYCQPGQIIAAYGLLSKNPSPNEEEIKIALSGNLCRCGTYPRIIEAIKSASTRIDDEMRKPDS